jgi:hypothetical protein
MSRREPPEGCGGLVAWLFGKSKAEWLIASVRDKMVYLRLRARHIDICPKLMTSCAKAGIVCRIPARQAKLHLP